MENQGNLRKIGMLSREMVEGWGVGGGGVASMHYAVTCPTNGVQLHMRSVHMPVQL